jgi:hypothetical protein
LPRRRDHFFVNSTEVTARRFEHPCVSVANKT